MKNTNKLTELVFTMSRLTRDGIEEKNSFLSYIQFQTLSFLQKQKKPTMKEISKHIHITAPSATILIDNLVRMKLVSRIHDKIDRRIIRLIITTEGKEELKKGLIAAKKHLIKIFSKLSEKDKNDLMRVLTKLSKLFN